MQNRYVGDIGDFGKYCLLNALAATPLRLGVVWYFNPDEEANSDGRLDQYPELRECDPCLYDALASVRQRGRSLQAVQRAGILPPTTLFFAEPLRAASPGAHRFLGSCNEASRLAWHRRALSHMSDADIVFMDPDNGLAGLKIRPRETRSRKYAFLDEIAEHLQAGRSVILYHHQTRRPGGVSLEVAHCLSVLSEFTDTENAWAFIFRRRSVRYYFVMAVRHQLSTLRERSRLFMRGPWGLAGHFSICHP